ncbi:MAG: Rrf2 family transcriptional regulator [Gammaproteobacteria bacterium]|nr:Rrf2 family transcriptional regulator [Gammaproteobacteria bacterium]MDH5691671.1 Rrf2 family transcriptional regulator [Gammaproteobacteria bacterium]
MRLQGKARIATMAMMDIAVSQGRGLVTIAEIAEHLNISLSYLEQLFAELRKSGLVKGTRGPGGGYTLARNSNEISIFQIIEAVDDKAIEAGEDEIAYPPNRMWNRLAGSLNGFLSDISLGDLIAQSAMVKSRALDVDSESTESSIVAA